MFKTFKGKLLFGTLAITSISNLILTLYINRNITLDFENKIKADMNNIKIMVMNNVRLIENTSQKEVPREIISDIRNNFKSFLAIANESGELREYSGRLYYEDDIREIIDESNNKSSLLKLSKNGRYYVATYNYPIYVERKFYTNLIIQTNYEYELNNKSETLLYIILGQGILLILLSMAMKNMINRMTEPLKILTNNMKKFANGNDVEDIVIKSNDEIEDIANSFNNMKEDIKNQMDIIIEEKERVLAVQKLSTEFFNNATHELKTPITAISGYSQMLRETIENGDEFTKRALDRTVIECEKLKILIQNILDTSKGNFKNQAKVNVNLKLLIEEILRGVEARAKRVNLNINSNIDNINIVVIKSEIEQIIINLVDNAIKYTKGNTIIINLLKVDDKIIFTIQNKCNAIPDNIKDRLLEPFVKYNVFTESEKSFITSSGLGLYLCNEISKRNDFKLSYKFADEKIVFTLIIKGEI